MIESSQSKFNNIEQLQHQFRDRGWMVVKLPNTEPIYAAREALLKELQTITENEKITLENYHQFIEDDSTHIELQYKLAQLLWSGAWEHKIIAAQLDLFAKFLGQDLNVQSKPHLRIARPHKPQDNIGYHRDTYYGGSPFELSVLVPYVNVPEESSLSVLSGSHIRPESDFPTTQIENPKVKKGSVKNQLGFLYAPKLIDKTCIMDMHPIPLKLGEALVFSLATVHGSVENRGHASRWSSDIRIVNALAPINGSLKPGYYQKLSRSIVTEMADVYRQAQLATPVEV